MENRLLIACCNLAIELREKDFGELSKREKQFLNAFNRYSDALLDKHTIKKDCTNINGVKVNEISESEDMIKTIVENINKTSSEILFGTGEKIERKV